jgi:hypothetical protein
VSGLPELCNGVQAEANVPGLVTATGSPSKGAAPSEAALAVGRGEEALVGSRDEDHYSRSDPIARTVERSGAEPTGLR